MKEKFLEEVRSGIDRYSRAADKETSVRDERLLKEIHRLCCLIADKNNGTDIAALREIAQKLATLREEAGRCDEIAAAIYDFGYGRRIRSTLVAGARRKFDRSTSPGSRTAG